VGSVADCDRSSPNKSQLNGSTSARCQCFWTSSSARPTPRSGKLTTFFKAFLTQQKEQAERDKDSFQTISSVLGPAVQCYKCCEQQRESRCM